MPGCMWPSSLQVPVPAEVVEYACNMAPDLMGEFVENVSTGMDTFSIKQPLGVSWQRSMPAQCLAACFSASGACEGEQHPVQLLLLAPCLMLHQVLAEAPA